MSLDGLTQDHDGLRRELDGLERALDGPVASGAELHAASARLFQQLHHHVQQERRFAVSYFRRLGRLGAAELARLAIDHDGDLGYLRVITRCLAQDSPEAVQTIRPTIRAFLSGLRRRMEEQEAELFPLLGHVLMAHDVPRRSRLAEAIVTHWDRGHQMQGPGRWPGVLLHYRSTL